MTLAVAMRIYYYYFPFGNVYFVWYFILPSRPCCSDRARERVCVQREERARLIFSFSASFIANLLKRIETRMRRTVRERERQRVVDEWCAACVRRYGSGNDTAPAKHSAIYTDMDRIVIFLQ